MRLAVTIVHGDKIAVTLSVTKTANADSEATLKVCECEPKLRLLVLKPKIFRLIVLCFIATKPIAMTLSPLS